MKVVLVLLVAVHASIAAEFVCDPNESYRENNCNNCRCGNNGTLACTMKACNEPEYNKLRNCVVGTTYKDNCNDCWCTKQYGTVCTLRTC